MKTTYLFYDIETTGLNPCFDQVLQFAAIRTDESLNELERFETLIRINTDVTPSPEAMQTHGLPLEEIAKGENEYEAMRNIHRLINTPGTISLGYNTLGFDDEFLRFSFYRNLLPPYTHQFANRCGRMDIYPMTLMYYLFKPNVIQWPMIDDRISLKLENINKINNFIQGTSHHAMVDVEVTLALAKKLFEEREMWNYLCGYFSKQKDTERLSKIQKGIIVNGKIGSKNNFIAPVLSLGTHQHYKNQTLWLRLDDDQLDTITPETIEQRTFSIRKKMGESPIILPNQNRFTEKLSDNQVMLAKKNQQFLKNNPNLLHAICDYHQHYTYPEVKSVDADAALYQIDFPSHEEEALFREFHQATPEEKQNILALFPNPIRKEQALRILGRHYPGVLNDENKLLFEEYQQRILDNIVIDYKGNIKKAGIPA